MGELLSYGIWVSEHWRIMSLLHILLVPGGRIFYLFICHVIFAQII